MSEWHKVKLGEIFEISSSKRVLQEDWKTSGVPFYRAREIVKLARDGVVDNELFITEELYESYRGQYGTPKAGDLMVSAVGTLGACYVVQPMDRFYYKDASVLRLSPKQEICSRFIWHAFQTQEVIDQIHAGSGSTVGTYTIQRASETRISLPSLPEQRRIATILDQADALRAKRREVLAQLDSLTQSIFIEMFGDPTSSSVGWPSVQLSDAAEIVTGYAFRSDEYVDQSDESVRLCRGANVLPGRLDWSDLACWPKNKTDGLLAFWLRVGDIVIAMDRPWISEGFKIAQISESNCPSLLVQRVARIRGNSGVANIYLYHLFKHPTFTRYCRPTETTVPHISPLEIRSFRFYLPPETVQENFVKCVESLQKVKAAQHQSLTELDTLFASLQHRAFRGEL